jgi:hypothetical protein
MTARYNSSVENVDQNVLGKRSRKIFLDQQGNRGYFVPVIGSNDRLFHFMPAPKNSLGDRRIFALFGPPPEIFVPIRSNVTLVSILSGEVYTGEGIIHI